MVWFVLGIGILSLFAGVFIFVGLGITSELTALMLNIPLSSIIQAWHVSLHHEEWLTIPLFILAGYIMLEVGAAKELVFATRAWLGRLPGGLALVSISASGIFGACSGSMLSGVVAIGTIMIPMMVKEGYDRAFACALMAISGVLAVLIPPSNVFIIYCCVTSTPIGPQFLGGIPAGFILMVGLYLAVIAHPKARIRSSERYTWREKLVTSFKALPVLGMPLVILGGIYSGVFTPVEAGAAACWYISIIGLIERRITLGGFIRAFREAMKLSSIIFMLMITAVGLTAMFSLMRIPSMMTELALGLGVMGFLLMVYGILIFLGFFLEAIAAMVVLVPIAWEAILAFHLSYIYFGVIMTVAVGIGYSTPPVCISLYAASSVGEAPPMEVARKIPPFLGVLVVVGIIVLLFPELSTWLPGLLGAGIHK